MAQLTSDGGFNWRSAVYVSIFAGLVLLSLVLYSPYAGFLYIFPVAPFVCLVLLALMVASIVRRRWRQLLSFVLTLVAFLGVSGLLLRYQDGIRASFRWLLWSNSFKAELLAQPSPPKGQLKHMEWESSGFAGVGNNITYLVFDPTDSLFRAHTPGKFNGIPCEVPVVRRLEKYWYSVEFYTDEFWGQRDADDCTGTE